MTVDVFLVVGDNSWVSTGPVFTDYVEQQRAALAEALCLPAMMLFDCGAVSATEARTMVEENHRALEDATSVFHAGIRLLQRKVFRRIARRAPRRFRRLLRRDAIEFSRPSRGWRRHVRREKGAKR